VFFVREGWRKNQGRMWLGARHVRYITLLTFWGLIIHAVYGSNHLVLVVATISCCNDD
jgi:hypothetical protein